MQQQITRGDYLEDLITIYIDNNLQQSLTDLYSMFVFQCGEIQKQLSPASVIKISFTEAESKLLTNYNTCYLAGITQDGHKETFNGSISFNTRGEVVYYEPTPNGSLQATTTSLNDCPCRGITGVFANCTQPAIKAYFSINYVPTKLSELENDTDFQDSVDVASSIATHNASEEAHPYIRSVLTSTTEALAVSIQAETTARIDAVSLAISTTEAYTDTVVSVATEATKAYADSIVSTATTATEAYTDSVVQSATTAINTTIGDLSQLDTSVKSSVTNAINAEVSARQNADNNLQGQIDALAAASDVTDIVGTYAELQAYDTQHLNNNDIIKVLSDETHDDEPSYYRFNKTTGNFSYIGSESAAYTKAQSDSIFVTQTTTVNGKALSSDISLTYSDVNALSDAYATTIASNTSAIASNTSTLANHTSTLAVHTSAIATNTSDISTINGKIPTDASTTNKLITASILADATSPLANQDLSNLSDTGNARLHALKAYADEGALLTDAEGLANVKRYAHSTFDRSKFTVVGSPVITSDGLAGGFSSSNYVSKSINFNPSASDYWEIQTKAILTEQIETKTLLDFNDESGNTNTISAEIISITLSGLYPKFWVQTQSGETINVTSQTAFVLNQEYTFKIGYNANGYYCKWSSDNTTWTDMPLENRFSNDPVKPCSKLFVGWRNANHSHFWGGTIDLKQLLITVNGVSFFRGNKTGLDVIKLDSFTTTGSPSITFDGILSNTDNSNYLAANKLITYNSATNNLKIKFKCKTPLSDIASETGNVRAIYWSQSTSRLTFNKNGFLVLELGSVGGAMNWLPSQGSPDTKYYNENVDVEIICEGRKQTLKVTLSNGTVLTSSFTANADFGFDSSAYIHFGQGILDTWGLIHGANLDLNSFRVYVDDELVYQPCLKIPYTWSKTGSKIANAIYRDRVNDMAEQFGFAPYYTLSDTDFTLSQVELYGLIGQRTLRDSYRNGATYWELWSDRTQEIGGTCTSGVEYNLPRSFASATGYVLSIPYSAKTASSFTPTASGDFIAKGLGVL